MTWRPAVAGLLLASLACSGCLGPVSLHQAVLGYDHTVSRLGSEILLVNIGRLRHGLPVHFTQCDEYRGDLRLSDECGDPRAILRRWAERGR